MRAAVAILVLVAASLPAADERTALRDAVAALHRGDRAAAKRSAREALAYLDRLPPATREAPDAALLRMQALYLADDRAAADALFTRLSSAAPRQPGFYATAGRALGSIGEFDKAEALLTRALAAAPEDFGVLYDLGVAASYAGHHERARDVLEAALRQQPQNVDVLYGLAYVYAGLKQKESAVRLLAQAGRLAPHRPDIQKLLAIATGDLGAFADSLDAWNRYLELVPGDDFARRERGYTAVCKGQFEEGIADLRWFLARHPDDPAGHFELGMAQTESDPAQALGQFDRALALDPDFIEARAARGSYLYRQGKPEAALPDLEFAAAHRPSDAASLDRLGQTYLALDRPADAVRVLRRAAALAPGDPKVQLHFGRALADAGLTAESKEAMDRFRRLGPEKKTGVPAGLVEYLALTPEQQRADYRARVEKTVQANPADASAQLRYLQLLLDDGNLDQAAATARRILALHPDAAVLAGAGRMLLESREYALAAELLQQVAGGELDLAIATFHEAGAAEGLARMDHVPESGRGADYFLARALMLEASGKPGEALAACDRALANPPSRPDFYQQAAAFLTRGGQSTRALRLLEAAPQSREILLIKATTLELAGQTAEATRLLNQVQNRWPEWHAGWAARGVVLGSHGHCDEARQALETAVALGARSPEVRYYLSVCSPQSKPGAFDPAEAAAQKVRLFQTRRPQDW